ncbi:MAG: response regulator transcription factor [Prolixibacteraceae bacterium]|nr:response regulator transcription factor [Prolixibacteraceae bacterium]
MDRVLSAMIIDDDPMARKILKKFLEDADGEIKVVSNLESTFKAMCEIEKHRPDVLFLDINMPREDGLRFAKRLNSANIDVHIIFTTAFQHYAFDAFSLKPFDFLVKPFTASELQNVLEKVKHSVYMRIENENTSSTNFHNLKLKTSTGYVFINPLLIVFIKSAGNNCELFNKGCEPIIVNSTISKIYESVRPLNFLRINRSVIINLKYLVRIDRKERICYLNCGRKELSFHFTARILSCFDRIDSIKVG